MTSLQALVLTLIVVSTFSLLGAFVAYIALPKIKAREHLWQLFAGYLMILLAIDLLSVHLIHRKITEMSLPLIFNGFGVGFLVAFISIKIYSYFNKPRDHNHGHTNKSISILLFLILAIHEVSEGASVAGIFFEITNTISISATLLPVLVLALHEFPEGLLLVVPFFMEKKVKAGLAASFINQSLFIVAGIFVFVNFSEMSIAQEAFLSTLPAGGIFFLGVHELQNAFKHRFKFTFSYTQIGLAVLSLISLIGVLGSLYFINEAVTHSIEGVVSGTEYNPFLGKEVPIIYGDPCEHEIDIGRCLFH